MSSSRLLAGGISWWLKAMNDVTRILSAIEQGDGQAAEQLLPLVYDELRKLAAARMAAENPGHTLNATALVHEAYLRSGRRPALRRPRPLLRRRGGSDAAHPGQPCSGSEAAEAGGRAEYGSSCSIRSVPLAEDPDLVLSLDELLTRLGEEDAAAARSRSSTCSAGFPSKRRARRWGSPGRWPTGTGSTPGPGSARPWKNNSNSVRHFSPGWGIESMPRRWGRRSCPSRR